jgi:hypothetical protein
MYVAWLLCVRFSRFLGIAAALRKNRSKDAAKCAAQRDDAIMATRKRQPLSRNKATTDAAQSSGRPPKQCVIMAGYGPREEN